MDPKQATNNDENPRAVNPTSSSATFDHEGVTLAPQEYIDNDELRNESNDSLPRTLSSNLQIGDYGIIGEVARGGMGVVYLAKHRHLGRKVALKTMLLDCETDPSAASRFAIEAEAVARLDHPGIVTIYEVGEFQGQPFLAMKFIEGGSLAHLLRDGPLDANRALEIAIEIANAIAHAHLRGVIHRDLKPANILLDQAGHAVVTDFGVAKFLEATRCQLTTAGEPIGTPHFMPPEQADPSRAPIGAVSDVYSIGAVLYAMLTGRPPFQAASALDVIMQVLSNDPVSPKRLNSTVPLALDAVVMRCLRKDPKQRYQTAAELAKDLCCVRDGKPTIAKPMQGISKMLYFVRQHVLVATVSGSVVILLLLTTSLVLISYVRLVNQKLELENSVADLTDVLASERILFRMRVSSLREEKLSESGLIAERLASYSSYIAKQNPELATRLAIESIKQSQTESQIPASSAVKTLQNYLVIREPKVQKATINPENLDTDISALINNVEKTLTYQLTDAQKVLLGIGNETSVTEVDSPLPSKTSHFRVPL